MEYLGVLAFVIVLCYMSKLIEELVGRDCKISSEKGINFEESFYQKKRGNFEYGNPVFTASFLFISK